MTETTQHPSVGGRRNIIIYLKLDITHSLIYHDHTALVGRAIQHAQIKQVVITHIIGQILLSVVIDALNIYSSEL